MEGSWLAKESVCLSMYTSFCVSSCLFACQCIFLLRHRASIACIGIHVAYPDMGLAASEYPLHRVTTGAVVHNCAALEYPEQHVNHHPHIDRHLPDTQVLGRCIPSRESNFALLPATRESEHPLRDIVFDFPSISSQ